MSTYSVTTTSTVPVPFNINGVFNFYSSDQSTKATYTFWVKVWHDGGFKWAYTNSTNLFTLDVICGPLSTTVSEGAFTSSYTMLQYIRKSMG